MLRFVLEYSRLLSVNFWPSVLKNSSVNLGDYKFLASYVFHHGSGYGLASGVGFAFFAYLVSRSWADCSDS